MPREAFAIDYSTVCYGRVVLRTLLLVTGLVLAAACATAVAQSPLDKVTAAMADVRVTAFDTKVIVRMGQTVGMQPPAQGVDWQVDFDNESLRLITPAEELAAPGVRGWVWLAVKAGESELVLTSRTRCSVLPCAPNVMKFTVQLDVRAKE